VTFTEVNFAAGILPSTPPPADGTTMAAGCAAADYDNDGWVDLYVPNPVGVASQLYHNLGNGQFEEIASQAGVASVLQDRAALWFDYDGDQDLDLLVTRDSPSSSPFTLYGAKSDGTFEDVTAAAGLDVSLGPPKSTAVMQHRSGACAGDYDNDGWLDVCVTIWNGSPRLFRNNQDGTFTEQTQSSGVNIPEFYWQPGFADLTGDGWLDLYLAVDFGFNQLWVNQKDGSFVEVAAVAGADNRMNDMCVTFGDHDNDGDFDIYITNIDRLHEVYGQQHNVLLRNDSVGASLSFTDVSTPLNVDAGYWGVGRDLCRCKPRRLGRRLRHERLVERPLDDGPVARLAEFRRGAFSIHERFNRCRFRRRVLGRFARLVRL
jgi:hypothetical protein